MNSSAESSDAPSFSSGAAHENAPVEHLATVVRGASAEEDQRTVVVTGVPHSPDWGEASQLTVLRPVHATETDREQEQEQEAAPHKEPSQAGWAQQLLRPIVWGSMLSVLIIVVVIWNPDGTRQAEVAHEKYTAQGRESKVLASGLGTQVTAEYDGLSQTATFTFTFSSQKAALKGDILQVLPALEGDTCPDVAWEQGHIEGAGSGGESKCSADYCAASVA